MSDPIGALRGITVDISDLDRGAVHLDFGFSDFEALISTVEALGGSRITAVESQDYSLTVLAVPDGNEFCILDRQSAGLAADTRMP